MFLVPSCTCLLLLALSVVLIHGAPLNERSDHKSGSGPSNEVKLQTSTDCNPSLDPACLYCPPSSTSSSRKFRGDGDGAAAAATAADDTDAHRTSMYSNYFRSVIAAVEAMKAKGADPGGYRSYMDTISNADADAAQRRRLAWTGIT